MIVIKKILLVRDNFPRDMLGVGIVTGWQYTNYRERQVMLTISKKEESAPRFQFQTESTSPM